MIFVLSALVLFFSFVIVLISYLNSFNPQLIDFLTNSLGAMLVVLFLAYKFFYIELKDPDQHLFSVGVIKSIDENEFVVLGNALASPNHMIDTGSSIRTFTFSEKFKPEISNYLSGFYQAKDKKNYYLDIIEHDVLGWLSSFRENLSMFEKYRLDGGNSSFSSYEHTHDLDQFSDKEFPKRKDGTLELINDYKIFHWSNCKISRSSKEGLRIIKIKSRYSTFEITIGESVSYERIIENSVKPLGIKLFNKFGGNYGLTYYSVRMSLKQSPYLRLSKQSQTELAWYNRLSSSFRDQLDWKSVNQRF